MSSMLNKSMKSCERGVRSGSEGKATGAVELSGVVPALGMITSSHSETSRFMLLEPSPMSGSRLGGAVVSPVEELGDKAVVWFRSCISMRLTMASMSLLGASIVESESSSPSGSSASDQSMIKGISERLPGPISWSARLKSPGLAADSMFTGGGTEDSLVAAADVVTTVCCEPATVEPVSDTGVAVTVEAADSAGILLLVLRWAGREFVNKRLVDSELEVASPVLAAAAGDGTAMVTRP